MIGALLKKQGLDKVEAHYPRWIDAARAAAMRIAQRDGEVSIDKVLEECPRPFHVHPNATGAVFRGRDWVKVGYRPSTLPAAHARVISVFRLKGRYEFLRA